MTYQLLSIKASGGYLEQCKVNLTPGLNCIIGPRGTCKSTLVESIRFAFDVDTSRVTDLLGKVGMSPFSGMISATLGGGTVACSIADSESLTEYVVERDISSRPRIYKFGVQEYRDTSLLHNIEIYSQGDLQRIAESDRLRLQLIDRPHKARKEQIRLEQLSIAETLSAVGSEIYKARVTIDQLKAQTKDLPSLRRQLVDLSSLKPQVSDALNAERYAFLQRRNAVQRYREFIDSVQMCLSAFGEVEASMPTISELATAMRDSKLPELSTGIQIAEATISTMQDITSLVTKLYETDFEGSLANVSREVESANEAYYILRQQEEAANESIKVEDTLKQQIEHLESFEQRQDSTEKKLLELLLKRNDLRTRFQQQSETIYELRSREVEDINARCAGSVVLRLTPAAQNDEYARSVAILLKGSNIRGREDLADAITERLNPSELIDMVEQGNAVGLAAVIDRDPALATKILSSLYDSPSLYALDGEIFEDDLQITMFDRNVPKPIETLSKGQKATALLPLILRDAEYPLVFDQPEDDLDNRFIYQSLVANVQKLKINRQLIFITHNANIPVIGEAENVVVMKMDAATRAGTPTAGTFEEQQSEIIDLLEGGARAFEERGRLYARHTVQGTE